MYAQDSEQEREGAKLAWGRGVHSPTEAIAVSEEMSVSTPSAAEAGRERERRTNIERQREPSLGVRCLRACPLASAKDPTEDC